MNSQHLILGDWGTSSLTLMLYGTENGQYMHLQSRKGLGAKFCQDFEEYFHQLADEWYAEYGNIPAILSGMVGAAIGWYDTGYLACPLSLADLAAQPTKFISRGRSITLMGGAKCCNRLGNSDVMRGEEMQIFGWLAGQPDQDKHHLLCLPGTHTKWALTSKKNIQEFLTIPSGELHNIISQHSIFVDTDDDVASVIDATFFKETIERIRQAPEMNFLNMVFSTRSKRALGHITNAQAHTYLSALLIGFDVRTAISLYGDHLTPQTIIPIIGAKLNAELYAAALTCFGLKSDIIRNDDVTSIALLKAFRPK